MYNLLASIIAVAIGVFMTSAGLYYGGAAYSTSAAKAQAMQIIAAMEQIDSAWTIWSNDGNSTTGANPSYTLLTAAPYYLSATPTPPSTATAWSGGATAAYVIDGWGNGSTNGGGAAPATETTNTGVALLLSATTGGNACLEMAKAAGVKGVTSTATSFPTAAQTLPNSGGGTTNVTLSGITTKAEFDALAYNYRFFCVQTAATWGPANLSFGNSANTTFTAGGGGDASTYIAYFKHQ